MEIYKKKEENQNKKKKKEAKITFLLVLKDIYIYILTILYSPYS